MGLGDSIKKLSSSLGLSRESSEQPKPSDSPDVSEDEQEFDLARLQESDSDSETSGSDAEEEENPEEEDIALSEAELDDDADVIPFQKTTANNVAALKRSLKQIELPEAAKASFVEHLSVTAKVPIELKDLYDDTERELAFYKQALTAVNEARKRAKMADIPFSRPVDYFAEMVKSDEHMDKVKRKLVEEERSKRASQEARKQRELKKHGKKVQHERLQQRQKDKKETLDKIKNLKRKRQNDDIGADDFSVGIDDALADKKEKRDEKYKLGNQRAASGGKAGKGGKPNPRRAAKNARYGGGHKRGEKKNSSESSMDVSGFRNKRRK